ncbi:hypothetical protein RhiirA5_499684 [Rhizophagus irregularis]|uniref:Uncharacterized protein n=2 Tax=Rhizophagus irregularis TaxID=588596 RepID=A0A2I1F7A6_9GLOM|nr:hypothetical protein RhiirA5_499684 [Rhizophagus irregularis]PKY30243.1 hypothetical protein RhiirB3_474737 [Rhizophagus irregularis]CAB4477127.1 unnamed protein product [Rhizophagus irregularis]CAB5315046.1 unnamed protein product [Rhizophagus irregularis]
MTNIDGNMSESTINNRRTSSTSLLSESSESININLFENDVAPNFINNLGQTIVTNFKKCSEDIIIDNSEIMTVINQAIGEQREVFREFIEASIKSSNNLSAFSIDILFFVECFKNTDQFSNEENLDLLRDLLEKSERNYKTTKELKNIISKGTGKEEINETEFKEKLNIILDDGTIGMKEKLTKIHNFLKEYIDDINRSPHKIDSVQKSSVRANLSNILQIFKDHPIYGTIGTLAFLGGSVFADCLLLAASVYATGSAGILCNDVTMKRERDNLVEKINQVCDGLNSIVVEIGKVEVFWSEQTERIKYLINNLARFNNENARVKRYQIANQIERRWKDVEEDCKNYSRLMKDVLNRDRLIEN